MNIAHPSSLALASFLFIAVPGCTSHGGLVDPGGGNGKDGGVTFDMGHPDLQGADAGVKWDEPWNYAGRGLYGGLVTALAMDPRDPAVMYAAANYAVFKTTDGGASWSLANRGLPMVSFIEMAIDPSDPSKIYVAGYAEGLYRSSDGGSSWAKVAGLPDPLYSWALGAFPGAVYLNAYQGTFRSTDGGMNFVRAEGGLPKPTPGDSQTENRFLLADPRDPQVVYAKLARRLYCTMDGGTNWALCDDTLRSAALADGAYGVFDLVVDPMQPDTMYALTGFKTYKTTDGRKTWIAAADGLPKPFLIGFGQSLAIDPKNPASLYLATLTGTYRTVNGGSSWDKIGPEVSSVNDQVMFTAFFHDPRAAGSLYAADRRGVHKSTDDGAHFVTINNGITGLTVKTIALAKSRPQRLYAGTQASGIFRSEDGGATWVESWNGAPSDGFVPAIAVDQNNPDVAYAVLSNGLLKTRDGGQTWTPLDLGVSLYGDHGGAVAIDPRSSQTLNVGRVTVNTLFRSKDGGQSFYSLSAPMASVSMIAMDPKNAGVLYAGNSSSGLWKTTNDGATFSNVLPVAGLQQLIMHPMDSQVLYAIQSGKLLRSGDGGTGWAPQDFKAGSSCGGLLIAPADPLVRYATVGDVGNGQQLFRSIDGGTGWTEADGLLPKISINPLVIDPNDPKVVYVATGRGLYKTISGGL